MTMDERTARDAATIRARGALAALALCLLLAMACAAFALTAPGDAAALLWVGAALAVIGALAALVVQRANRRLAGDPRDGAAVAGMGLLAVAVLMAWAVGVLVVLAVTREVVYTLAALAFVVLVLPPLVMGWVTAKGPHPS
ncbi:hypothetical protein JQN72_12055 [Phycicoccus sp. CSK15P-2]|uniref:hypothetical protein n=1 Tax=Phycicoccus sp. CSK15P-2 TaxID=2807627 RepID=UPI00194F39EA|nr:hypothetical protein [Phycicoccus sp. CSK15P-2]MBM6404975.1 hypothetical protein [Phycicoccus sp. CSK15P-2]